MAEDREEIGQAAAKKEGDKGVAEVRGETLEGIAGEGGKGRDEVEASAS